MANATVPRGREDEKGLFRIATGAGIGLAAALLAVVIPTGFLLFASYDSGGFVSLQQTALIDAMGLLILAGAILFLISLFLYRRGFAHLRKVDSRFWAASVLCLIGSIGFLLILVAAVAIVGGSNGFLSCMNGHPAQALSCLRSGNPVGAYAGLLGFWLGWLGGVGIVVGLSAGSSRFHVREIAVESLLYAILLLALIGPFIALVVSFPGAELILVVVPVLSLLAPYFVFRGDRPLVT